MSSADTSPPTAADKTPPKTANHRPSPSESAAESSSDRSVEKPVERKKRGGCLLVFLFLAAIVGGGYAIYKRDSDFVARLIVRGDGESATESSVGATPAPAGEDRLRAAESAVARRIDHLAARVAILESELAGVRAAASPAAAVAGWRKANAGLRAEAAAADARLDALESQSAVSAGLPPTLLIAMADLHLRARGNPADAAAILTRALEAESGLSDQTRAAAHADLRRLQATPSRARLFGDIDAARRFLARLAAAPRAAPPRQDDGGWGAAIADFAADILVLRKAAPPRVEAADAELAAARAALAAADGDAYRRAIARAQAQWRQAAQTTDAANVAAKLDGLAEFGYPDYRLVAANGLFDETSD